MSEINKYIPDIRLKHIRRGRAGVRAQVQPQPPSYRGQEKPPRCFDFFVLAIHHQICGDRDMHSLDTRNVGKTRDNWHEWKHLILNAHR